MNNADLKVRAIFASEKTSEPLETTGTKTLDGLRVEITVSFDLIRFSKLTDPHPTCRL